MNTKKDLKRYKKMIEKALSLQKKEAKLLVKMYKADEHVSNGQPAGIAVSARIDLKRCRDKIKSLNEKAEQIINSIK